MSITALLTSIKALLIHIHKIFFRLLTDNERLYRQVQEARREYLCLLSHFNELSCNDPHFEEIIYRLLAAEKLHASLFLKARQYAVECLPTPHNPARPSRGVFLNGCWHHW